MNGKLFPNDGLSLGIDHEKTTSMDFRTLFGDSGIHHSNSGLQITLNKFIIDYFMLIFEPTLDRGASESHTSHSEQGNIRLALIINKPLPEKITCLLYLEFDTSVLIIFARHVTTLL